MLDMVILLFSLAYVSKELDSVWVAFNLGNDNTLSVSKKQEEIRIESTIIFVYLSIVIDFDYCHYSCSGNFYSEKTYWRKSQIT